MTRSSRTSCFPLWRLVWSCVMSKSDGAVPSIFRFRSEEHTSELQSQSNLVCRLLLEKKHAAHGLFERQRQRELEIGAAIGRAAAAERTAAEPEDVPEDVPEVRENVADILEALEAGLA